MPSESETACASAPLRTFMPICTPFAPTRAKGTPPERVPVTWSSGRSADLPARTGHVDASAPRAVEPALYRIDLSYSTHARHSHVQPVRDDPTLPTTA